MNQLDNSLVTLYTGNNSNGIKARILIFQESVHLYNPETNHLIATYLLKEVSIKGEYSGGMAINLSTNTNHFLEIPYTHTSYSFFSDIGKKKTGISVLKNYWKPVTTVLLLVFLVFGLFFGIISGLSKIGTGFISPKKEAEIGEIIYSNLMEGMKEDKKSSMVLTEFAEELKLSKEYNLKFTVINEEEVNAFAIPGGRIVVYKGILKGMKRPEELVALLGHESTHVNERHSLKSILREMTGGMILSMIFGDFGGLAGTIASNANLLRNLSYSRSLEEEADKKGMQLMIQNGVNPMGMVRLMDRLEESENQVEVPAFLSTHPLTESRKKTAKQFLKNQKKEWSTNPNLEIKWEALKETVSE